MSKKYIHTNKTAGTSRIVQSYTITMSDVLASVASKYNNYIANLNNQIQQQRIIHEDIIMNALTEGVLTNQPREITDLLSTIITKRDEDSNRKLMMDIDEWTKHDIKTEKILGHHRGVLTGGDIKPTRNPNRLNKAMLYTAQRSNAYVHNLHQKLQHDRSLHSQELEYLHKRVLEHPLVSRDFKNMVHELVTQQYQNNVSGMVRDVDTWSTFDDDISNTTRQNISNKILSAGAISTQSNNDENLEIDNFDREVIEYTMKFLDTQNS